MRFGLLGRKLSHSLSPRIHAMLGDYEYLLYPVEPEKLDDFFENNGLDGFNVTIPYKIEAMKRCSSLSDAARETGSVNTVIRLENGGCYGDNTDIYGFERMAESAGCDFHGKKVLILGSGGARRTAEYTARKNGASEIVVISRSGENNYDNIFRHSDAEILINTTPVGMYPENGKSPVKLEDFPSCRKVLDLIYNPFRTKLLLDAERLGIDCVNGLGMLTAQAVRSASLFTGVKIPDEKAEFIRTELLGGRRNILLAGMPGCGKTTVGRLLAEKLGREFADSDAMIEAAGESIPDIFEKYGEAGFRQRETAVIKEICRESGRIISVGGGAVINPENRIAMRENSFVIFLDAPLERLETRGRPLSESPDALKKLYDERIDFYRECADTVVPVSENPDETAERVIKCVSL